MDVIGGADGGMSVNAISRYDAGADAWEVLPDCPSVASLAWPAPSVASST